MFGVVIIMLGVVGFFIWNQQVGREGPMVPDMSVGRDLGGSPEPSEPKSESRATEEGPSTRTGSPSLNLGKKDKADSRQSEGAKSYQVDIAASRVYVKVGSATRIGHRHGVEGKLKSGAIALGAGGELVFDMTTFTADTQEARKRVGLEGAKMSENEAKQVNETMRSADVLDVEKFPTATYKIIVIKPAEKQEAGDPGIYQVNGRLTLHGAEQPIAFRARLERTDKEGVVKLSGAFVMKQTAFGIKPYSAAGGLAK
ncbi:MAG TPA: YceI family protein, partial [Gemmataceae bacterium]|nr:YceI family protein [Gemmataceae bacterium]